MTERHHRRSIRLQGYDYSLAGAYFVTVCAKNRECLFGEVVAGKMRLNDAGQIVVDTWSALPERFPKIDIDEFVVMPNHIHGIIKILADVGAGLALPLDGGDGGAASGAPTLGDVDHRGAASGAPALGDVVRVFKSISAITVNRLIGRLGRSLWQRNYYEHIIRNEDSLDRIRIYIAENPVRWAYDRENPKAAPSDTEEKWAV